MKSFWVVLAVIVVMLLMAGFSCLYSTELASFFNDLGWGKVAGLFSGAWWNSLPTLILAIALVVAVSQVVQARRNTQAQIALSLFQELRSPEALDKLRNIYNRVYDASTPEAVLSLKDEQKEEIEYILDRFDVLAVLVENGIVDPSLAIDAHAGTPSLRCWYRLHGYIRQCREKRGYFAYNFEAFVRRSLDHFRRHNIRVSLYIEGMDTPPVVLTDVLTGGPLHPRTLSEIKKQRKDEARRAGKQRSCGEEPEETTDQTEHHETCG